MAVCYSIYRTPRRGMYRIAVPACNKVEVPVVNNGGAHTGSTARTLPAAVPTTRTAADDRFGAQALRPLRHTRPAAAAGMDRNRRRGRRRPREVRALRLPPPATALFSRGGTPANSNRVLPMMIHTPRTNPTTNMYTYIL